MSNIELWLSIALGVFVAVVYPVLYRYIRREAGLVSPWVKEQFKKYGALFAFSLTTAFIVLSLYRSAHPDTKLGFWTAVGMGFGFEASVEKVVFPKSTNKKTP